MKTKIIGIKLVNGMEIVGEVVKETTKSYSFKNAVIAHPQQVNSPDGPRLAISLMPVTFFAPTTHSSFAVDIEVNRTTVVFSYELNSEIMETYLDSLKPREPEPVVTSEPSKLILPNTGKIIT